MLCQWLDDVVWLNGCGPAYTVSDQGPQFQSSEIVSADATPRSHRSGNASGTDHPKSYVVDAFLAQLTSAFHPIGSSA
jgi:hypothetical protein